MRTLILLALFGVGCGGIQAAAVVDGDVERADGGGSGTGLDALPVNAQTPPTEAAALQTWLTAGDYKSWHCETAAHAARPFSAHSRNRICSNTLLSGAGAGEFPVGAASVKELVDDADMIFGYAVALHYRAGGSGADWYWYEATNGSVYASGAGDSGNAKSSCVACHSSAGPNTGGGHDFVFTQVQ